MTDSDSILMTESDVPNPLSAEANSQLIERYVGSATFQDGSTVSEDHYVVKAHFRRTRIIAHGKCSYEQDRASMLRSIETYTGGCSKCHITYRWLGEYEAVQLNMINLPLPDPGMGVGVPLVIPGWELTPVARSWSGI